MSDSEDKRGAEEALDAGVVRHIDHLLDVYFAATDNAALERMLNGLDLTEAKYQAAHAILCRDAA